MSKGIVGKVLIGAAIIGAAFITGGASLIPTTIATGSVAVGGATIATLGIGTALATTALGGIALAAGASLALSGIAQGLAGKPKVPGVSPTQLDRLQASLVATTPRKMVFGRTAMATDIRYVEPSGKDQEYVDYIVSLAAHRVSSIDELWFEDAQAWTASNGVLGIYQDYLTVDVCNEGSAANAISINGGGIWNAASCRLTGCAYLHLRIKRSGTSSPFTGGLPSRMTVIGRGMAVYDPRRDSTVPGGSGPMRADDQNTWVPFAGGVDISSNLALQALAYLLGWHIAGKLSVGRGIPPKRLDLAGWITAANLCEEGIVTASGGWQARYVGAGVVSEADDPGQVLQTFATGCNGRFRESLGKLGLVVMHNDLALAAADAGLGDDDMIGGFTWNPDPSLEQCYNVVRGRYTDPSPTSLYQLLDYPEVRIASTDGIDRVLPLDLPWVEDVARAQRIAKQVLERKQYQRTLTGVWNMAGWCYKVGDVVPITLSALGFNRQLFRIESQVAGFDGTCPMMLTVEDQAIYAWDKDDRAPVTPADPIRYDPLNNPVLLAIDNIALTPGAGAFTLKSDGNVILTPTTVTADLPSGGPSTDWTAGAHSLESFTGAFVSCRPLRTDRAGMFGLNTDAGAGPGWQQLDLAFYFKSDGTWSIRESGSGDLYGVGGAYSTSDVFMVRQDSGRSVTYLINGTVIYTRADPYAGRFFFDCSLCFEQGLVDLVFAPVGPQGYNGASGTNGASVFHLIPAGSHGTTVGSPNSLYYPDAGPDWGDGGYTQEAYAGGAFASARSSDPGRASQIALGYGPNTDPFANAFIIYLTSFGQVQIYNGGNQLAVFGGYASADVFAIVYNNARISYQKNGAEFFGQDVPAGLTLCANFSLCPYAGLSAIAFGPSGQKGKDGVAPSPSYPAMSLTGVAASLDYVYQVAIAAGSIAYFRARLKVTPTSGSISLTAQEQFSVNGGNSWNVGNAGGIAVGGDTQVSGNVNSGQTRSLSCNGTYTNTTGETIVLNFRLATSFGGGGVQLSGSYIQVEQ